MPSPERVTVRLYVRDGCHLCEEAEQLIDAVRHRVPPFDLELVDIETDPALHSAYLERIPVAEVGGHEIFELIPDEAAVVESLRPRGTL